MLIAYGRLTHLEGKEFIISQMVVEPNFQSQGFGGKIMESMLQLTNTSPVSLRWSPKTGQCVKL
jgi:GNAT superfamily N-acetyltransferase